jgi:3-hydroxyisobutyrate dehydrogenase/2-hydroxy-3-oxopropionate reductase
MSTVAVVGLGNMGARIARRLLDAGHDVVVWNRTPERIEPLVELGAHRVATPAAAAKRSDFLITMVADPRALRTVSDGPHGVGAGGHADLTVIEMSTVGPAAVRGLRAVLPAKVTLLDAPVLGSVAEAEAGELTILVGGPESAFEGARPLLAQLGAVVHVGPLGAGAAAKLVANATLFGTVTLLGEAIAFGRALGLPEDALYAVLRATPLATQAERRRQAIAADEYPRRFGLALAAKDASLVAAAANAANVELRLIEASRSWLADAEATEEGESDYTVVLAHILRQRKARQVSGCPDNSKTSEYDALIIDLDGVVWLSGEPIDGAVEAVAALREHGTRLLFLTNDPSRSRAEQAARLNAIGIHARADDVMTSATATAHFLAGQERLRGRAAFVIGSPAFRQELVDAGFVVVTATDTPRADLVVVGGHPGFNFVELRGAIRAVVGGAQLFAAGRDPFVPTPEGPEPATGAILAAVETASGVTATVVGKPEAYMFELARDALADCEHVAVVGDNLASDIAGAKGAGLDAILVLTGAAEEADLAGAEHQPDLVLASLAELAVAASRRRR